MWTRSNIILGRVFIFGTMIAYGVLITVNISKDLGQS